MLVYFFNIPTNIGRYYGNPYDLGISGYSQYGHPHVEHILLKGSKVIDTYYIRQVVVTRMNAFF